MFTDRVEAGRQLAAKLVAMGLRNPVVLALPRGGVPVAAEVARALGAPLDLMLVRKIGAPWQPEFAVAAVVEGDPPHVEIDPDMLEEADTSVEYVQQQVPAHLEEIARRRRLYLAGRPPVALEGRTAVLVDDGIATGTTVRAALQGLRARNPARVVLAVPVAPAEEMQRLATLADEVVVLQTPTPFRAVGMHYACFDQTSDAEVIACLNRA
jgi:putative phosphoribosyl transferase